MCIDSKTIKCNIMEKCLHSQLKTAKPFKSLPKKINMHLKEGNKHMKTKEIKRKALYHYLQALDYIYN